MKKIILITGILFLFFCGIRAQEVTRGQLMQLFYSAQKYQKDANNKGAIQSYSEIVKLAPALPEPYLALGFLYSANDDDKSMELALHSYRKYIELAPHDVQRDSIARIVSALEQYINLPESNMDDEPVIEWITENIPDNNLNDDQPKPNGQEISRTMQPGRNKALLKTFAGKWISDRFVQSTMVPQWVFDISGSGNSYKISFHSASQRYSKQGNRIKN
jgi:tetratricopeptide (TPR) repeat protein